MSARDRRFACQGLAHCSLGWHHRGMPRRSRKPNKAERRKAGDENETSRAVLEELAKIAEEHPAKSPVAVFLGRRGGLKGGRARMDRLSPEDRRRLGLKGARARWGKRRSD